MSPTRDDEGKIVLLPGDKVIHLDDRLNVLDRKINMLIIVVGVLVLDHIDTLPSIIQAIEKLAVLR